MICKDGACAERHPKQYQNDIQIFSKAPVGPKTGCWHCVVVTGSNFVRWPGTFEISSCERPRHVRNHFLSRRLAGWRDCPSSSKEEPRERQALAKTTNVPQCMQTRIGSDEGPSRCVSKLCLGRGKNMKKQEALQNDRGLTNVMTHFRSTIINN